MFSAVHKELGQRVEQLEKSMELKLCEMLGERAVREEKKWAELSGLSKGLQEEVQALGRRCEQLDERFWKERSEAAEAWRSRLNEVEREISQRAQRDSLQVVSVEENLKRTQA